MLHHSHQFTIADREAVRLLRDKVAGWGAHQKRRERLLNALDTAIRAYGDSAQKERQAFFHGLVTGYAVALKLW
jgi:hypothetical protein